MMAVKFHPKFRITELRRWFWQETELRSQGQTLQIPCTYSQNEILEKKKRKKSPLWTCVMADFKNRIAALTVLLATFSHLLTCCSAGLRCSF